MTDKQKEERFINFTKEKLKAVLSLENFDLIVSDEERNEILSEGKRLGLSEKLTKELYSELANERISERDREFKVHKEELEKELRLKFKNLFDEKTPIEKTSCNQEDLKHIDVFVIENDEHDKYGLKNLFSTEKNEADVFLKKRTEKAIEIENATENFEKFEDDAQCFKLKTLLNSKKEIVEKELQRKFDFEKELQDEVSRASGKKKCLAEKDLNILLSNLRNKYNFPEDYYESEKLKYICKKFPVVALLVTIASFCTIAILFLIFKPSECEKYEVITSENSNLLIGKYETANFVLQIKSDKDNGLVSFTSDIRTPVRYIGRDGIFSIPALGRDSLVTAEYCAENSVRLRSKNTNKIFNKKQSNNEQNHKSF